jgi:mono/diheme cytochrome c family protein
MRCNLALFLVLFLIAVGLAGAAFAMWFDLSALPEPGRFESYVATKGKQWLVYRESRLTAVQEPAATAESLSSGRMTFQGLCATCHGFDGRTPSQIGQGLYPRAPDLGTAEMQRWSNRELFWIIRNGIRLSGMPAFGKQLSNKQVWELVHYVRRLQPPSEDSSNNQ